MARPVLAVFDDSPDYVNHFIRFVSKLNNFPFEVKGFTEAAVLKKYISAHESGILLFSLETLAEEGNSDAEKLLEYLLETDYRCIYLGERRNSVCKMKHIDKYQPAAEIIKELLDYCAEQDWYRKADDIADDITISGIYLPIFSEESLDKILETVIIAAADKKALFLSLRRFSGLEKRLGIEESSGLSDIIYYYRTNQGRLRNAIIGNRARLQNIDALISAANMEDLDEIRDWPAFIRSLANEGGYETIVIDMGEAFRNLEEAFEMCSKIFIPWQGKLQEGSWISELRQYFLLREREDLLEKVNVIS